jgi:nucleoside-diphosphate-sugar epimerase
MGTIKNRFRGRIASVVHLAAYFDFTGEDNPLYTNLNVEGTRRLLRALQAFQVGQFVYSGTMLVHKPDRSEELMDESLPIATWAYPKSKAAASPLGCMRRIKAARMLRRSAASTKP